MEPPITPMHDHNITLTSSIIASAEKAEFFFRLGMEASGNENFTECIDSLLQFINRNQYIEIGELNEILRKMLLSQENKNWILLSDIIYYDFINYFNNNISIRIQ
jgi:hypothetical protein